MLNLMDLDPAETEQLAADLGQPAYRGRQIFKWTHQKGIRGIDDMTDLPRDFRVRLKSAADPGTLTIQGKQESRDGTVKYLFGLADGQAVESVFLPQAYGYSVCVSSQVGCRMGCSFCASTIGGMVRNLTAGEIYAQVMGIQQDRGVRVSGVVLMGSGEPMDNLGQVLKCLHLIVSPAGLNIGARHITLSTCGVVPGIRRLAQESLQITLSVSLHAPNDELRSRIMPINKKYPISLLLEACRAYSDRTNRRVSFEYALIAGFNDSREQAGELGRLLKGLLGHVNLIPLNAVEERGYRQSEPGRVQDFREVLEQHGIPVTVRKEKGADIDAACGQLRRRAVQEGLPG